MVTTNSEKRLNPFICFLPHYAHVQEAKRNVKNEDDTILLRFDDLHVAQVHCLLQHDDIQNARRNVLLRFDDLHVAKVHCME